MKLTNHIVSFLQHAQLLIYIHARNFIGRKSIKILDFEFGHLSLYV